MPMWLRMPMPMLMQMPMPMPMLMLMLMLMRRYKSAKVARVCAACWRNACRAGACIRFSC